MRPPGYCSDSIPHHVQRPKIDPLHAGLLPLYRWDQNNGDKALKEFGSAMDAKTWHIGGELVKAAAIWYPSNMPERARRCRDDRTKPEA